MAPKTCLGLASAGGQRAACAWSINTAGAKAVGKYSGLCVWCNPQEMEKRCNEPRLKKLLLASFKQLVVLNAGKGARELSITTNPPPHPKPHTPSPNQWG